MNAPTVLIFEEIEINEIQDQDDQDDESFFDVVEELHEELDELFSNVPGRASMR